jgi:hypothetical protein
MEHQQDESVTGIETPFGNLTLIASTGERIVVSTSGRGRERPLQVSGCNILAEFELRLRAGKWTVSEDNFFSILFETADGHRVPASTQARVIRAIVPVVTKWAAAHPAVLLRAEEETFRYNHNGLCQELPDLAECLEGQAQKLVVAVELRALAGADRGLYNRMLRISAALRVVVAHVAALSEDVKSVQYQATV